MDNIKHGYKAKTIKAVLLKKFNEFLASIEDDKVRDMVEKNTIITGGCIASMLLGEKINDFDLYFTNIETVEAVANYYVNRFKPKDNRGINCPVSVEVDNGRVKIVIKSAGIASSEGTKEAYQYFENRPQGEANNYVSAVMPGATHEDTYNEMEASALEVEDNSFKPVFMSTNAITLSSRIQLVLRFYGDAEEIHKNYDFVHCTNYWESAYKELTLRQPALEALLSRELRYSGSKYPLCSIIRTRKFIQRGWSINAGQILKMAMQLNELDLTDIETLREQLTGVDSAYFVQVLDQLKKGDSEKINCAYLIEIIDRMF